MEQPDEYAHRRCGPHVCHYRQHVHTPEKTLAVLQDYDHHKNIYKDVPESKLLSRDGNDFKYYRLRVLKNGPINGVFRTEFEAH